MKNSIEELHAASMALDSAVEMLKDWGDYADEYYQKKHGLEADIAYLQSHAARAKEFLLQNKFGPFTETGLEPPGCPVPGACGCPSTP
jgi:hypothetical protein